MHDNGASDNRRSVKRWFTRKRDKQPDFYSLDEQRKRWIKAFIQRAYSG